MSFLAGLPSFVAIGVVFYVVAESGSGWIGLAFAAVGFVAFCASLRRDAVQAGAEDPAKLTNGAEQSVPR